MSEDTHTNWQHCIFMCILVVSVAACTAYETGSKNACGAEVSATTKGK